MFYLVGGLGTTHAYLLQYARRLQRFHTEWVRLRTLPHGSKDRMEAVKTEILEEISAWVQRGERMHVIAFSASCTFILHALPDLDPSIRFTLVDAPNLFHALWDAPWRDHRHTHPSYDALKRPLPSSGARGGLPWIPLLLAKKARVPMWLRTVFALCHRFAWCRMFMHAVICYVIEKRLTPYSVHDRILSMSLPMLRAFMNRYMLCYDPFPVLSNAFGTSILPRVTCVATDAPTMALYADLLQERNPFMRVRRCRHVGHHVLFEQPDRLLAHAT